METLWKDSSREKLSKRLDRLTPDTPAQWGKMNAPQMLAHLSEAMKMATGELQVSLRKSPLRHPGFKHLIIYGPPFPKGVPTSPELLTREATDWNGETAELRRLIDSFAAQPQSKTIPAHPVFGKMSRRLWGALTYKHIDHHFRQFGI
jgi:hypothetical protein